MTNSISDLALYEEIKTSLNSKIPNVRKQCLKSIHNHHASNADTSLNLLKLVVDCFEDRAEICRENALNAALKCVSVWNLPAEETVSLLVPAMRKRVGSIQKMETSEEIRLLHVKLLKIIIVNYKRNICSYLEEAIDIITSCIDDQYPEMKKESCECVSELTKVTPEFRLHSEKVLSAIMPVLKHKHSKIRISAIACLADVVLHSSSSSIEVVCGCLGECLLDYNPHVRGAVLKTVTCWLLELRERYSYFHLMLPLILTMLTDENEKYREDAEDSWHKVGIQFIKENETLKTEMELLPTELEHYPTNVKRPNLGCRTIVKNEMAKIIPAVLKESEDWKSEVRIKASELFTIIVLHAENNIVPLLDKIFPSLYKVYSQDEISIRSNIVRAAEIMGYFVPSKIYWTLIQSHVKENKNIEGIYAIFACLLKCSPKNEISQQFQEIVQFLADDDVCETKNISSTSLLQIILRLFDCCEDISIDDEILNNLYKIWIFSMVFADEASQKTALESVRILSEKTALTVTNIHKTCLPVMFLQLHESCTMWAAHSFKFNVFLFLLAKFPDDVLEYVPDQVLDILRTALDKPREKEMTFQILYTVAQFLEKREGNIQRRTDIVEKIILGPLKPQLIWRGGRIAEVIRATALSTILLFVQRSEKLSEEFLSHVTPQVLSLCEDCYEETRMYSLEVLSILGNYREKSKLVDEMFTKIFIVAAGRLDDKHTRVRRQAVLTVKNLLLNGPKLDTYIGGSDFENVTKAVTLLFINADDNDSKIRELVLDVFSNTSIIENVKLLLSVDRIASLINKFYHKDVSDMLEKHLKI